MLDRFGSILEGETRFGRQADRAWQVSASRFVGRMDCRVGSWHSPSAGRAATGVGT